MGSGVVYLVEQSLGHRLAFVIDGVRAVDGPIDPLTRACPIDTLREVDATCRRGVPVGPTEQAERQE